jgi:hypothetical protein
VRAYYHIRVHREDIQKISTPFDLFEFNFIFFGLRSAAQTFQSFKDVVLQGTRLLFCLLEQHSRVLPVTRKPRVTPMDILGTTSLVRDPHQPGEVCFGAPDFTIVGYKVSAGGYHHVEKRVTLLQDCHTPKTASKLRRFLNMLRLYRRFLTHVAAD